jgi:nucleoside 2-deoxyribosyltransferase
MKITICGSLKFFDKMVGIQERLEEMGHEVFMPIEVPGLDYWSEDGSLRVKAKSAHDLISEHFRKIEKSDAVLIVNVTKRDIKNYIGANTFLELGFAHYLGKRIYLLNPIPDQPYILDEVLAISAKVLDGDVRNL